jgi:hypothetical protein
MTPDPYQASGGPSAPQSWNRYAYTAGDPVNRLDPTGLEYEDVCSADGNYCGSGGDLQGINQGWGCNSVYVMTAIDGVQMPSPCDFVPVFFMPQQPVATCAGSSGMGKAGTIYTCLHQSGSDWKELGSDLKSLIKDLAKDTNCDNLLTSAGTSMSQIDNVLSNPAVYYTLGTIWYQGQYLAGTTYDLIGGTSMVLASGLFGQGAGEYQAFLTVLHELAHYTNVFGPENVSGNPSSAQNDQTITKDCSKTLLGN